MHSSYPESYEGFCEVFIDACAKSNATLEKLRVKNGKSEYFLFKASLETKRKIKNQQTIVFTSGIHGDERSGPIGMLEFIKKHRRGDFNTKIALVPIMNPRGFERSTRTSTGRHDLNRHFCERRMKGENRILLQTVKKENPDMVCSFHEDDRRRFYLYGYGKDGVGFYKRMIKAASKTFPINMDSIVYGRPCVGGIMMNIKDGSLEDRVWEDGIPLVACFEVPDIYPMKKRVSFVVSLMENIIDFAENHLT